MLNIFSAKCSIRAPYASAVMLSVIMLNVVAPMKRQYCDTMLELVGSHILSSKLLRQFVRANYDRKKFKNCVSSWKRSRRTVGKTIGASIRKLRPEKYL
jgi:hypothetical protein